ncbi:hypothetical protein [Hydrogenophaga crassostreae]|nr:hypothetical protein [Hydrogenophaga crassostreae]
MKPAIIKAFAFGAAALALLGTFALYNRPDFLVNLADQLWSCF